jgi:hypothetical protein
LPLQFGWQHVVPVHLSPAGHAQSVGHELQSSRGIAVGLHVWSPHDAFETHLPMSQRNPAPQAGPHVPAQPSSPHCLPAQFGMQQAPDTQRPALHAQSLGHDSHVSPGSHCPLPQ